MPDRKNYKSTAAILMVAIMAFTGACSQGNNANDKGKNESKLKGPGRKPQAVSIAQVTRTDLTPHVIIAGQVQAVNEARVFPTSQGARVMQLLADAGDYVNAGQALARLDARQTNADSELLAAQVRRARTALAEAEVAVRSARENLVRGTSGPKESALNIEPAQIAAREAKAQYDRAISTNDIGVLSKEEIERRRAAWQTAEARLKAQQGDIVAIMDSRRQGVNQSVARLEAARADLSVALAQQAQSNSRQMGGIVSAPTSGLITSRNVSVGDIAGASGLPMFTIVSGGALEVAAEISEADISRLSQGMSAQFKAPDGTFVNGVLRRLPAQIDPQKRTGIARFTLEPSSSIKAGVFLNGEAKGSVRSTSTIPSSAILYDREGASVFVMLPDETVTKQKVLLGGRQGDLVEIVSGPAVGSWIVTAGASFLAEKEKISPVKTIQNVAPKSAPAPILPAPPQNKQ